MKDAINSVRKFCKTANDITDISVAVGDPESR